MPEDRNTPGVSEQIQSIGTRWKPAKGRIPRDPWGDMIRGVPRPWMVGTPGTTQDNVEAAAELEGSWEQLSRYGIPQDLSKVRKHAVLIRLKAIQDSLGDGSEALLAIGSGDEVHSGDDSSKKFVDALRGAADMYDSMSEPWNGRQLRYVASLYESGDGSVKDEAAFTFWVSQFTSRTGIGDTLMHLGIKKLVMPLAHSSQETQSNEMRESRDYLSSVFDHSDDKVLRMMTPATLIRVAKTLPKQAESQTMLTMAYKMEDLISGRMEGKNWRDWQKFKASLENDMEDLTQDVFYAEGIDPSKAYDWSPLHPLTGHPTENFPSAITRGFLQRYRVAGSWLGPTGAFQLGWIRGAAEAKAAFSSTPMDPEERIRLASTAASRFSDPFRTIVLGKKPTFTWGDSFGKRGEAIKYAGESIESLGKRLPHISFDPAMRGSELGAKGNELELLGRIMQDRDVAPMIAHNAEVAAFMGTSTLTGLASAPLATSSSAGAKAAAGIGMSNLWPMVAGTPEQVWPVLATAGLARTPIAGRILNPRTGRLMLPRVVGLVPGARTAASAVEMLHPLPRISAEFYVLHQISKAGKPQPIPTEPSRK